ncbi:MAG: TetR/AcrR family transcriptional regulator [Gammaproteobacteria bacterium]|nr:TetR/AcrR family transcriptional regulator [Gammaproteobacteria bacterium]MBT7371329.1 TetR/AcrR family transcriptional regulator [Gammaproteobacteria bacterium]
MEVVSSDKRQATRKALLSAAKELVFEKGHDRISVQEITSCARVATGTYYNYFDSKQDIFYAVADDMKDEMARALDDSRAIIKDPAMLVSVTLKYYFYQTIDNDDWREFTHCVGLGDLPLQQSSEQCLEDIQRGIKAGRFRVDDIHFTQNLVTGMVSHVSREIQKGRIGRNAVEFAIRSILQMLGLPDLVSKALTQTPLPPIAAPKRARRASQTSSDITSITEYSSAKKTL